MQLWLTKMFSLLKMNQKWALLARRKQLVPILRRFLPGCLNLSVYLVPPASQTLSFSPARQRQA
jgi:hypothetical protein